MKKLIPMVLSVLVFAACSHDPSEKASDHQKDTSPQYSETQEQNDKEHKSEEKMSEDKDKSEEKMIENKEMPEDKTIEAEIKIEAETSYTDATTIKTDYSLDLSNFKFSPNIMEMKAGETITVRLENVEGKHDFVIDELGVQSTVLNTGASEVLKITAPMDSAGKEYSFYCSIGRHRENGMEGLLKIIE